MAYTDELDRMLDYERALRGKIAARIAQEAGAAVGDTLTEAHFAAADEAISAWTETGEEEYDSQAFRPTGPLQDLLAEHLAVIERIMDERDRRLS